MVDDEDRKRKEWHLFFVMLGLISAFQAGFCMADLKYYYAAVMAGVTLICYIAVKFYEED